MEVTLVLFAIMFICKMAITMFSYFVERENFFEFNLMYLMLVGLWPDENWSKIQYNLYKIYEIFIHLQTVLFLVITGIGIIEHKNGGVTLLLSNLDKSLVAYHFAIKAFFFTAHRNRLRDLINDILHSGDTVSKDRRQLMIILVIFVTVMCLSVVGTFCIVAQLEFEMPVEAWMPFDPLKSQMHLALAAQILTVLLSPCMCRALAMQGIVCSLTMYICDQLIELQQRLRDLTYSQENENSMRQEFHAIVKKHIRMMGYSKSMNDVFTEFFLVQNLAVTVELCLNAIMFTLVQEKKILAPFLGFLLLALLNAYIFCYLGNELIIQSESIALAAYDTSWISWPVDLQKDLLILIRVAQRPYQLSAGGITMMCIQTFSQALYNGYSIFAVLKDAVN